MPNWCFNSGSISGSKESIKKFIKDGLQVETLPENMVEIDELLQKSEQLTIGCWLPMPQTYNDFDTTNKPNDFPDAAKEQKEKHGAVGWYDWRMKHYGCKWDCVFDNFQYTENNDLGIITFNFDSPWSPPIAWFENMQEKYPELDFEVEYIETGMCYAGSGSTYRDDDTVYFQYGDYDDYTESPLYELYEEDEED